MSQIKIKECMVEYHYFERGETCDGSIYDFAHSGNEWCTAKLNIILNSTLKYFLYLLSEMLYSFVY